MTGKITMGKIKPGHIHPRLDHFFDHFRGIGCRAYSADQFCFILRKIFHINRYQYRLFLYQTDFFIDVHTGHP